MRREKFLVNFCCCSGNLKSLFFCIFGSYLLDSFTSQHLRFNCYACQCQIRAKPFMRSFLQGFQEYPEYKSFDSRSDFVLHTQVPVSPFGNLCPIIYKGEILFLYSCWSKNDYAMEISRKN